MPVSPVARKCLRVCFALVLTGLLSACDMVLFSNLSEREANKILAHLKEHGISASKQSVDGETVTVMVDEARFATAIQILERVGLPREKFDTFKDTLGEDGLVTSPSKEHARLTYVRSQELSGTISEISGVLSARVHLSVPKKQNPFDEISPPSASIFIRFIDTESIDAIVPQIKRLVANGVAGLHYENISVALIPESYVEPPADSQPGDTADNDGLFGLGPLVLLSMAGALVLVVGAACGATAWFIARKKYGRADVDVQNGQLAA